MPSSSDTREPAQLVDAVFGGTRSNRTGFRTVAWLSAIAAHVGLFFLAQLAGPSLETWSARVAAMVHRDLNAHAPTSIETLPPPEPPAAPPPVREPEPPPPPASVPRARTPQPPAAPAQAAKIVAAEPTDSNTPVDLTADTFVTGTADAYAGGATTSRGTNTKAVTRDAVQGAQPTAKASAAQPVSLTSEQWHCPWPAAALAQDLYEQAVIVRALVRADGSVERASVISDPGFGFGAAAVECALHTRFSPAHDAAGAPVRALSPPIRVRFTR